MLAYYISTKVIPWLPLVGQNAIHIFSIFPFYLFGMKRVTVAFPGSRVPY